jgi:hypothetical protein
MPHGSNDAVWREIALCVVIELILGFHVVMILSDAMETVGESHSSKKPKGENDHEALKEKSEAKEEKEELRG